MDADRKSTVSSFYGARKPSVDVLNQDYPPQPMVGGRRDDASSFFSPDRSSMDHLNGPRTGSAGYNRGSFFHTGREEPLKGGRDEEIPAEADAWDVYADFNNTGPRYSSAFGMGQSQPAYTQLPPTSLHSDVDNKVEMITVPALGAEWAKEELHGVTKAGKREKRKEARKEFWKSWNRGERGLCGRYFTRKVLVFFLFGLCCAVALVIAFTLPRVPAFGFNVESPLVNATGSWATAVATGFAPSVANFSFPAFASLQADTSSNFLPVKFTSLQATVFDLVTNRQVGTGNFGKFTLPAKEFPDIMLPLNFTYSASNSSDQTFQNWYTACNNKALHVDGSRPPLKFRLVLDMHIFGLPGTHSTSAQVTDADCPIELPIDAP
ncbi:hypothetical protein HYPSUDRAFT_39124 [Hypholoma sublateritium FD-334 SS-4]|uniref:Uncharacterized protein n=1 Tax=Hypholoma sublateritium (strain FD-334 SS-4) TaxID=945553 RepID=A0A0D2NZ80_HYPSF|nr:hypothetical protein HYPSUDRAFT_39124 [Hypholoma sublateritium FD-334 SS-4]